MKNFRKALSALICAVLALSVFPTALVSASEYTNKKGSVKVVCGKYKKTFDAKNYGKNFARMLNAALETAGKKASDKKPAKVTIKKGSYTLDRTIRIYSNTELIATGSKIRYRGNLLRNNFDGGKNSGKKFSGARNITITGGTWDSDVPYKDAPKTEDKNLSNTTMRFAHMKNLTIRKVTFKNNYNSHDIELGGIDGIDIYNCKFTNDKDMNKFKLTGGTEAVQVDVCHKVAVLSFPKYDNTACRNVKIHDNTFVNKYRAIGSHHSVPGSLYDNIDVYNNRMTNIGGIAINAVYWTNSKIHDNVFEKVGSGIDFSAFGDHNVYNMKKLSYNAIESQLKKSSTYIYNNDISVRTSTNTLDFRFGVRARGADCTGDNSRNVDVNKGVYHLYNAHLGTDEKGKKAPNTVKGTFNSGVSLNYAVDSEMKYNSANLNACDSGSAFGLFVHGCDNVLVAENTVKTTNSETRNQRSGATIRASENTEFRNNKISVTDYGVQLIYGSTGTYIHDNKIESDRLNCIYQSGKEDPTPNVKKKITIINNELISGDNYKNDAAINIILGNMDVFAHDNGEILCNLQGSLNTRSTTIFCDYIVDALLAEKDPSNPSTVHLTWDEPDDYSGFEIYVEKNGEDVLIDNIKEYEYTAVNAEPDTIFKVVPYVTNTKETLYGKSATAVYGTPE